MNNTIKVSAVFIFSEIQSLDLIYLSPFQKDSEWLSSNTDNEPGLQDAVDLLRFGVFLT